VHVDAGQTARVDLTLSANAVVVGKVVDKQGAPVAGVPVAVVPDSGSGGLIGIEGTLTIRIVDSEHFYEFNYSLPPDAA